MHGMFVCSLVCLSSALLRQLLKSYIFHYIFGGVGLGTRPKVIWDRIQIFYCLTSLLNVGIEDASVPKKIFFKSF